MARGGASIIFIKYHEARKARCFLLFAPVQFFAYVKQRKCIGINMDLSEIQVFVQQKQRKHIGKNLSCL